MSSFDGAVIREQGVVFGVVAGRRGISGSQRLALIREASRLFGGIPVVAMDQDHTGVPTYYGRRDLVNYLASLPFGAIPWRRYTVS